MITRLIRLLVVLLFCVAGCLAATNQSAIFPRNASGDILVTFNLSQSQYSNGFLRDPSGDLVVCQQCGIAFQNGFLRGPNGELSIDTVATSGVFNNGYMVDPNGSLIACVQCNGTIPPASPPGALSIYNTTYWQQLNPAAPCGTNAEGTLSGIQTSAGLPDDPQFNQTVFGAYWSGPNTSYQQSVCSVSMINNSTANGAVTSTGCTDVNGHNNGSIAQLGNGYVGISFCSFTAPDACMSGGGAAGSAGKCSLWAVGNCVSCGGVTGTDLATTATPMALPVPGMSEATTARIGNYTLIGGQMQRGSQVPGIAPGSWTYVSLLLGSNGISTTVDTACAQGGALSSYNPFTTLITSACNGAQQLTYPVHDDVFWVTTVTADTAGTGSITFDFPAVGSFTHSTCSFSAPTGNAVTDTATIVSEINSGSLTTVSGTSCASTGTFFNANICANTSFTCATANQGIVLEVLNHDPTVLTFAACSSSGTLSCASVNWSTINGGGNRVGFQWGGMELDTSPTTGQQHIFVIVNNSLATCYCTGAYAHAGGYGWNLAVFCTNGPGPVWTWYDITCGADGFSEQISPGQTGSATQRTLLGSGGGGSCTISACTLPSGSGTTSAFPILRDCVGTCTPSAGIPAFIYSYTQANLASLSAASNPAPAFTAQDIKYQSDGNLGVAYGCPKNGGAIEICYMSFNATTGNPTQKIYVDSGFSVVGDIGIQLQRSPTGHMIILATTGEGTGCSGCSAGGNILEYVSTNNGQTWSRTVLQSFGGTANAQNACTPWNTGDGVHMYNLCLVNGPSIGNLTIKIFDLLSGLI